MASARPVCPLCGASTGEVVYDLGSLSGDDHLPGLVVRCASCPMWFKVLAGPDVIPTEYPGESGHDELAEAYLLGDSARALFREALAGVSLGPRTAVPRLLDLGAGQGALLEEARRMGFDAEGIDHCESNVRAAHARGLRVRLAAAEDLDDREEFDVITVMDLIEHVPDPLRLLRGARRALRPDGEIVVYTPNHRAVVVAISRLLHAVGIRHPVHEIFGRNHVSFFDDRSLPMALERTGFEVGRRRLFPYDPARPGQPMSPLELAAVTFAERLGKPFDRLFRMLVHARKSRATSD